MSKVVAIMSMSLDGYVADVDDGVAEVFDWYFTFEVAHGWGGNHAWGSTWRRYSSAGVRLFDRLVDTPVVLGDPTVIPGVGVTHLRYPVREA